MKFFTASAFEDSVTRQISKGIEVPSYFPFVRTERNIRIRYESSGKLIKLNTNGPLDTARLYKEFGLIEGYDECNGELVRMWCFNEVHEGSFVIHVKTTVAWEDITLTPAIIETIASRYEYQKQALSMGLIKRVVVDLFQEYFTREEQAA